ncbi:MAG: hypothetical protein HZB34_06405 [Nitrospirae bacterium]|nr:hypothetical protein [Nitrospirota bacterium]
MTTSRLITCGMCLWGVMVWIPPDSWSAQDCKSIGNEIWKHWLQGKLPRNQATIDEVTKIKGNCPQLSGSMDRIDRSIKGEKESIGSAASDTDGVGNELGK